MQNKHLLIITGPQGSGNHLFARIFSQHEQVQGWKSLLNQYWVPSDEEPFAEYWVNPEKLTAEYFDSADYFVANVSAPFFYDGVRQMPKIRELAARVEALGIKVTIAIVSRDININCLQQQRVGAEETLGLAVKHYQPMLQHFRCHFISHETFFVWGHRYIEYLGRELDFPVDSSKCLQFIDKNPNEKYVHSIDNYWLDDDIRAGRRSFAERSNPGCQD